MGIEISSKDMLVNEALEDKLLLEILIEALDELTDDERKLIDELFFNNKSERRLSKESGIAQKTINNRKRAILRKLRKFF